MAKYTYKEIKVIIENTPATLKGLQINDLKERIEVGYYHPTNANWSYLVYVVKTCDRLQEVAVVFGQIR